MGTLITAAVAEFKSLFPIYIPAPLSRCRFPPPLFHCSPFTRLLPPLFIFGTEAILLARTAQATCLATRRRRASGGSASRSEIALAWTLSPFSRVKTCTLSFRPSFPGQTPRQSCLSTSSPAASSHRCARALGVAGSAAIKPLTPAMNPPTYPCPAAGGRVTARDWRPDTFYVARRRRAHPVQGPLLSTRNGREGRP